jgi:predicted ATPase
LIIRLAVAGYRSLRDLGLDLGPLNIVTGANGSGKSSLYRALRLLSEAAQGRLISSLAAEGGLSSTLWAGPERIRREMRSGEHPVQGTRRFAPISLKLGFSAEDFGYAIDLGLPSPGGAFPRDPEIKAESMWTGEILSRSNVFAERRGPVVRLRRGETGEWRNSLDNLSSFDSMMTHCADPDDGLELLLMRERTRSWRFYDNLPADMEAPARRPRITTYTPALASDGSDLAAAIATIFAIGDAQAFADAVIDAFPGSVVSIAGGDHGIVEMHQQGLLRPLAASELSDGTLRYLLLIAALLSPRPPELMILNEPESSLHPSLLDALARLLSKAAQACQIVVVSHSDRLVEALRRDGRADEFLLEKDLGETRVAGSAGDTGETRVGRASGSRWVWPSR